MGVPAPELGVPEGEARKTQGSQEHHGGHEGLGGLGLPPDQEGRHQDAGDQGEASQGRSNGGHLPRRMVNRVSLGWSLKASCLPRGSGGLGEDRTTPG